MSTTTTPETVKEATEKVEANIRAQFIANRKEVLIKKWFEDFNDMSNGKTFEDLHREWSIDAHFGILSQAYTIPSLEVCEDFLNDTACTFKRFNIFFQAHLQLKK